MAGTRGHTNTGTTGHKDRHKRTHRHAPSDARTGTRAHMDRKNRTQRRAQQDKRTGIKTQGRHERT